MEIQTSNGKKSGRFKKFIIRYFLLIVLLIVGIMFTLFVPSFASPSNLLDILGSTCITGIMAIGMTFVMITGEIDFAASAELSLGGCLVAALMNIKGMPSYLLAVMITLALMSLVGLANKLIHVNIGVPSFIGTMAVSTFVSGVLRYVTNGIVIFNMKWPDSFRFLGQAYVAGVIPVMAIVFILVVAVAYFTTEYTKFGMRLRAIGMNPVTSRHVGINVKRYKTWAFTICSIVVGFAGIIQVSQLNMADPYLGDATIITCLSACMLGATFYRVGEFNVLGSAVAALLLAELSKGITMLGVSLYWRNVVQGIVLLIAIGTVSMIRKSHNG